MEGPSSTSDKDDHDGIAKHPAHLKDLDLKFSEHEIRLCTTTNSVVVINGLRNKPVEKSQLCIPLCRLVSYPKVRPVLEADVQKLQNKFVRGYKEGDRMMYVSLYNKNAKELLVDNIPST